MASYLHLYEELKKEKGRWNKRAKEVMDEFQVRGPVKSGAHFKRSIKWIHDFLQKNAKRGILLDVGCGNALITSEAADLFDFTVGLDISAGMIKRYGNKPNNLDFVLGSATDLPFRQEAFNSVMSVSLLEHIKPQINVEKALLEISRCSKEHAFLFLTFWNMPNSPTSSVKEVLRKGRYNLKESLLSRIHLKRYVKLWGTR